MKEKIIFWILFMILLAAAGFKFTEYQNSLKGNPALFKDKKKIEMIKRKKLGVGKELELAQARGVMPFSEYTSLIEESPFYKLQRETPKEEVEEAAEETPPERVVFVYRGVSVVNGRKVVALDSPADGEVFFVGVGDDVGSYFVESISDTEVVLFDGEQRLNIKRAE